MKKIKPQKLLITVPGANAKGGVASFYKSVLPHISEICFPLEIGRTKNYGGFLHPLLDQFRFHQTAKRIQPKLILLNPSLSVNSFFRDGLFAWQAHKKGLPFLVFWHGWDKEVESIVKKYFMRFFRMSFAQANGFIVLADDFKKTLRSWGIIVPIFIGTTSVEEELLTGFNLEKKLGLIKTTKICKILFLSRLEREKGVFETVKAVKLLFDKKLPVKLTIAGDGKIRKELERYTRSLGLDDNQVSFTGDIRGHEKIKELTENHVYCLPTYGEGLPTSVLEAMAFGMAVVTRPVGGLSDLFEDGKMGYLVQSKRPEEVALSLEKLVSNRRYLVTVAEYNSKYAQSNFISSKVAKQLSSIYDELTITNKP